LGGSLSVSSATTRVTGNYITFKAEPHEPWKCRECSDWKIIGRFEGTERKREIERDPEQAPRGISLDALSIRLTQMY
jgi:hypothetical protein